MNAIKNFYQSSIGKKWIVALTGLVLVGYVLGHLVGNLQIYMEPAQINWYAERLHSMGPLLWVIRAFLLACFGLHILTTIKLAVENRLARPDRYAVNASVQATTASKTMVLSGLLVLSFVVFHLMHFTVRNTDPRFKAIEHGGLMHGEYDVHTMVILGFQHPAVSAFYIIAMLLLCMHLSHGFSSVLQTLSLNSRKLTDNLVLGGKLLSIAIFFGYVSIPVAVLTGILKPVVH